MVDVLNVATFCSKLLISARFIPFDQVGIPYLSGLTRELLSETGN